MRARHTRPALPSAALSSAEASPSCSACNNPLRRGCGDGNGGALDAGGRDHNAQVLPLACSTVKLLNPHHKQFPPPQSFTIRTLQHDLGNTQEPSMDGFAFFIKAIRHQTLIQLIILMFQCLYSSDKKNIVAFWMIICASWFSIKTHQFSTLSFCEARAKVM